LASFEEKRKKEFQQKNFKKRVPTKSSKGVPAKAYSIKNQPDTNRPVLVIY
jgi:hypothetical protein